MLVSNMIIPTYRLHFNIQNHVVFLTKFILTQYYTLFLCLALHSFFTVNTLEL